jgi:hypothetical protein
MTIKNRLRMLMLGVCAGAMLVPAYASAQDAQSDRLQRQVDTLQRQLQTLQKQVDANKASQSSAAVGGPPEGAYAAAAGPKSLLKVKAPPALPIKMTWGGFLAAESVYRQHSTTSDVATPFTSIPFPFSPQYAEPEFRGSARASRISLLVEGSVDPVQKLAGYYEMDFLGVGATSNYNQSNSWAPRVRHAYFTYDNSDWGWHLLAGQSWSLLTQNTVGIIPRKENIPLVIDGNFVAGYDYDRNWQIRLVKDFGPTFALGLSAEAPAQQVYSSTGAFANNGTVNGTFVNFSNTGTSFLGSGVLANSFTTEVAPDIIGKAAFDPGWGHYEAVGLVRFFQDGVFTCSVVSAAGACVGVAGTASSHITIGEGFGGSVLLPVIPKFLDVQASTLYGKGIGRYGTDQLSDVVVAADGTMSAITALHVLVGAVAHPWAGLDLYGYAGFERAESDLSTSSAGVVGGFGSPSAAVTTGCGTVTSTTFSTSASATCTAINKEVDMVSVGLWQNILKGSYGRVAAGLNYEYIVRKSFDTNPGLGGAVSTNDNVIMSSLRYYPF